MVSFPNLIVDPAQDLSAVASVNSKACSTFKSGNPSISIIRPLKTLILFSLETVNLPSCMATQGIALTISLKVTPGCNSPLNLTNTDSGISKGITPNAAAKATKPEPAGKEIPKGKRV